VYSYSRQSNQSEWTLVANLTGSGTASAYFGYSVSLSADGTTLAVGEFGENSLWIYTAAPVGSGAWSLPRKIVHTDGGFSGDVKFGSALSLSASGATLAVGAWGYGVSQGAASVFARDATDVWFGQSSILTEGFAGNNFGLSVAINGEGNRIAVGAYTDSVQGTYNGAVYIYSRNETTLSWSLQQRVLPSDSLSGSYRYFGQSLSLSSNGDTLVVGGFGEGSIGMKSGAWWHFEWNGTLFEQSGLKKVGQPTSNGAGQGYSIDVSSDGQTVIGPCTAASARQPAAAHNPRSGLAFSFHLFPHDVVCLFRCLVQWARIVKAMPMCGHATCPVRPTGNS
jgi:hypothetical protein